MYRHYYGLYSKPFELAPDPENLYLSEIHKEGLAILRYGIIANKGFLVLTGEIGTGKTTLLQVLATSLKAPVRLCLLANPTLERSEFFFFVASKLGLPFDGNKAKFMLSFTGLLEKCRSKGEKVLLIIDEAHVLPVELLEEIRLLSNQAGDALDVLSIFLVGQPELNERLAHERLEPLRQRIGIRFHLSTFPLQDTIDYILYRLDKAGARDNKIFTEKGLKLIHRSTGGTPRAINILCDHALLSGYSAEKQEIDVDIIKECIKDLHLPGEEDTVAVSLSAPSKFWKWALFALSQVALAWLFFTLGKTFS